MTVEEIIKAVNHTTQEILRKSLALGASSHSSFYHEHFASHDTLCYEGKDNKGRMENLVREMEHLRMENIE